MAYVIPEIVKLADSLMNAVSADSIIKYGFVKEDIAENNNNFLLNLNDQKSPVIRQILEARNEAAVILSKDKIVRSLFEKTEWTEADRSLWEEKLSIAVNDSLKSRGLFAQYRTTNFTLNEAKQKYLHREEEPSAGDAFKALFTGDFETVQCYARATFGLNKVQKTEDMSKLDKYGEFDCDKMSATEITMMQQIENAWLPKTNTLDNLKIAGKYYMIAGNHYGFDGATGGHAIGISSISGNVLAATIEKGSSPYMRNLKPGYKLEHFLAGVPLAYGDKDHINELRNTPTDNLQVIARRYEKILTGEPLTKEKNTPHIMAGYEKLIQTIKEKELPWEDIDKERIAYQQPRAKDMDVVSSRWEAEKQILNQTAFALNKQEKTIAIAANQEPRYEYDYDDNVYPTSSNNSINNSNKQKKEPAHRGG